MRTASYAVMFTDIKGFTERTSRQTRDENARMLRLHDALLLPVIEGYGGRRVKTIGDAFLCVFDSSTRALACGAALQDRLAEYNASVREDERILVRVAVNAGEVRLDGSDVFGEAVNIASRVEGIADAGEVCFTEAALLLAERARFEVEELGPHELKGIPEKVQLFRLRRAPDPARPYGGVALDALRLPAPTPEVLARYRPPGSGRTLALVAAAVGGAVVLAAGLLLARSIGSSDPLLEVERLAAAGKLAEARAAMVEARAEEAPAASLAYLEGVLLEAEQKRVAAAAKYLEAGRADAGLAAGKAGPRLVGFLTDERCEVKREAARALGRMGWAEAADSLRGLSDRDPHSDGLLGIGARGGCGGDAAREALKALGVPDRADGSHGKG